MDVYIIVQQILKVASDFAKNASFNHEKVQSSPSNSSVKTSRFSDLHTVKVNFSFRMQESYISDFHTVKYNSVGA